MIYITEPSPHKPDWHLNGFNYIYTRCQIQLTKRQSKKKKKLRYTALLKGPLRPSTLNGCELGAADDRRHRNDDDVRDQQLNPLPEARSE
ncbi:hypothetical protein EVAR_37697_1 [Eumeta japonica]|uniref:Uncharacterized protein n=1 Tax=Eumeta variegata TaxID=151549 RepID=A0A4C1XSB0_EUMVA|nr:hypothetical protein EVAR_37697_1 [Eumeta japonica]